MNKQENHTDPEEKKSVKNQMEEAIDEAVEEVEKQQESTGKPEDETDQLKEELGKEKDKFLRLFAEFENYKRRTGKERIELFKTANQEVLQSLLPVLDDFDRALSEIAKSGDKDLLKGVELINNKLRKTLNEKGLEEMKVKPGDVFDAELHEAVTQIPAPDKKLKGKIVDVVEKGYVLNDRIIRYPKVVTGK